MHTDEAFALALQLQDVGRGKEADELYRNILSADPRHAGVRNQLYHNNVLGLLHGMTQTLHGMTKTLHGMHILMLNQAMMQARAEIAAVLADPRYADPRRLERSGHKIYSQNDEDGIIAEIFRRIGTGNKLFVEFGCGSGAQNNTLLLLLKGWGGLWLEGSDRHVEQIRQNFKSVLDEGRLKVGQHFITRENINDLIGGAGIKGEIDLISIDVDGNDYYIMEALEVVSPRVVVIEYNAKLPVSEALVVPYRADFMWNGTDYTGASLKAMCNMAARKGYSLVGCNITGVNAFFVRNDLLGDHFQAPFTAENFFQPPRFHLTSIGFVYGHPASFGPYDRV